MITFTIEACIAEAEMQSPPAFTDPATYRIITKEYIQSHWVYQIDFYGYLMFLRTKLIMHNLLQKMHFLPTSK